MFCVLNYCGLFHGVYVFLWLGLAELAEHELVDVILLVAEAPNQLLVAAVAARGMCKAPVLVEALEDHWLLATHGLGVIAIVTVVAALFKIRCSGGIC